MPGTTMITTTGALLAVAVTFVVTVPSHAQAQLRRHTRPAASAVAPPLTVGAARPVTAAAAPALSTAVVAPPFASSAAPSSEQVAAAKRRVTELNRKLRAVSPYVRMNADSTESINRTGALRAGHSPALVALATELIAYQNALLRRARQIRYHGSLPSVALAEYPLVRNLFDVATAAAIREIRTTQPGRAERTALNLVAHPCGDWLNPLPTANPARTLQGPYRDVKVALRKSGYHPTAGYACGRSSLVICRGDYTRDHRFTSRAGVCGGKRFRDQASPSSTLRGYARVQFGEPNPELASYSWPYWSWGAYVIWWHITY